MECSDLPCSTASSVQPAPNYMGGFIPSIRKGGGSLPSTLQVGTWSPAGDRDSKPRVSPLPSHFPAWTKGSHFPPKEIKVRHNPSSLLVPTSSVLTPICSCIATKSMGSLAQPAWVLTCSLPWCPPSCADSTLCTSWWLHPTPQDTLPNPVCFSELFLAMLSLKIHVHIKP